MKMRILIICMAACLLSAACETFAGDVIVIVNEKGPLVNISDKDIREIYLGEKKIIGDDKISVLEPKDSKLKEAFLSSLIKMSVKDYRIHWTKKLFQEGLAPPESKESQQEIIDKVKKELNAIGYIGREKLQDEHGIKIVRTIK